jgi:MYND finger
MNPVIVEVIAFDSNSNNVTAALSNALPGLKFVSIEQASKGAIAWFCFPGNQRLGLALKNMAKELDDARNRARVVFLVPIFYSLGIIDYPNTHDGQMLYKLYSPPDFKTRRVNFIHELNTSTLDKLKTECVKWSNIVQKCAFCLNVAPVQCESCGTPYCGVECQRKDWPQHSKECIIPRLI